MRKFICFVLTISFVVTNISGCSISEKINSKPTITSLIEDSDAFANIMPLYEEISEKNNYRYRVAVNWYWSDLEMTEREITVVYSDNLNFHTDSQYYVFLTPDTLYSDTYFLATNEDCIIKLIGHGDYVWSSNVALNKSIQENAGSLSLLAFDSWVISNFGEPKYPPRPTYSNVIT